MAARHNLSSNLAGTAMLDATGTGTCRDAVADVFDEPCFSDYATPSALVSAFCRAVICRVVPRGFWGDCNTTSWNRTVTLRNVDIFIRARKYETLSLHDIVQNMKVVCSTHLDRPDVNRYRVSVGFAHLMEVPT